MAKFQPILPPEVPLSDAELAFMDESPPGLFPENQNSNFGYIIRKIFSDLVQELINQQNVIYSEHFVGTSSLYLDEWERQVGLPTNPPGLSIQQRKNRITQKLRVGPFTRARRDTIVQAFVQATLGDAVSLTPQGVDLSAGVPLFSGLSSVTGAYTITENISGFSFTVNLAPGVTVDSAALTRELNRVVPAGISFTVTTGTQTFKNSGDTGHMTDTQSMSIRNVFTVADGASAAEVGLVAPRSVFATENPVAIELGMAGYGAHVYGAGVYGGNEKITGQARIALSPISTPSTTEGVQLRVRARKANPADAGMLIVWLYQGSTQIEGPYYIQLTDNFVTDQHLLRNANLISSWSTLEVRLQAAVTNVNGSLTAQVSFVELQASS